MPVITPITRINSQELFVVTHERKNEMQRSYVQSYVLRGTNSYDYWLNMYHLNMDNSPPFVLLHGYKFCVGGNIIIHSLQIKS